MNVSMEMEIGKTYNKMDNRHVHICGENKYKLTMHISSDIFISLVLLCLLSC